MDYCSTKSKLRDHSIVKIWCDLIGKKLQTARTNLAWLLGTRLHQPIQILKLFFLKKRFNVSLNSTPREKLK